MHPTGKTVHRHLNDLGRPGVRLTCGCPGQYPETYKPTFDRIIGFLLRLRLFTAFC